jgi:hypothetical protein
VTRSRLGELFKPVEAVHPPPATPAAARYLRSYLRLRTFVGALAVAVPFAVVLLDGFGLDGSPFPRTSLSAYYYSGTRELFVGALSAIGVFLITYKVAERNRDNTLSWFAGLAIIVVALCPTDRPSRCVGLTPLQDRFGESLVAGVHFGAAGVFILSLAVLSYDFGKREGKRTPPPGQRLPPKFWKAYHQLCAGIIMAALGWCAATAFTGWGPSRSLLYGEAVAVWAFGASWLWKGLERHMLRCASAHESGEGCNRR